jgi:hypothetical protein
MENKKIRFSWKAFISIGLFYSFLIIFFTGIILYLSPAGRIANWNNWKLLYLTKTNWQSIHTVFAFTFALLSIFHLFTINWKSFWSYLKNKSKQGLNKKREFYITSALTVLFFIGILYSVPPFSSIVNFGNNLKESWETNETAPPIPHAELLTLNELAEKLDSIPINKIVNKLEANKIRFNNVNETLAEISLMNNLSPVEIYQIITKKSPAGKAGSGMGRKTLEQIARENNLDINQIIKILQDNDIKAQKDQILKDIAAQNDMAAKDIFDLIKVNHLNQNGGL